MMSITDGGIDLRRGAARTHEHGDARRHDGDWLSDAVIKPLTDVAVKAIGMYGEGVSSAMEDAGAAAAIVLGSLDVARNGHQVVRDAAALALLPDDSPTRLKGHADRPKVVAWNEPLPLDG